MMNGGHSALFSLTVKHLGLTNNLKVKFYFELALFSTSQREKGNKTTGNSRHLQISGYQNYKRGITRQFPKRTFMVEHTC